ncbi:MAG: efflux RND transporter periplasmic adaptor subunit [Phycisphaeraceae bacterium]
MKHIDPKIIALVVRTVVGLVLLASAGAVVAFLVSTKPQVKQSDLETQSIRVQVVRVEPVEVARQWRGYGTTQAKDSADVPARVGATVVALPDGIEAGRVVTAGQVLAELDKTDFRNALNAAEKRIAEAQAGIVQLDAEKKSLDQRLALERQVIALAKEDLQRQRDRFATGSSSQADVDRARRALIVAESGGELIQQQLDALPARRAGLEAAEAAATADRDNAKANLQRTTITSPIDGIIESLDVEVGENLAPGARVARIIDPRVIELPLQLPSSARSFLTTGNRVTLTTRSQPDDCPPWNATITRIGAADSPTRTFTVFAEVDQSSIPLRNFAEGGGPHKLPAGAFALAKLDTAEPVERVILPARSIQEGRIRTVVDGRINGRPVDVAFDLEGDYPRFGLDDRQWVALDAPLAPGTLVVLSASMTILDGQRVEPVVANDRATLPEPGDAAAAKAIGAAR